MQPSATNADTEALVGGTNDPLVRAELDKLFDGETADPVRRIAAVFALMRARDDTQCDHIVPQALASGLSPDDVFDLVTNTYGPAGSALAVKARLRVAAAAPAQSSSGA